MAQTAYVFGVRSAARSREPATHPPPRGDSGGARRRVGAGTPPLPAHTNRAARWPRLQQPRRRRSSARPGVSPSPATTAAPSTDRPLIVTVPTRVGIGRLPRAPSGLRHVAPGDGVFLEQRVHQRRGHRERLVERVGVGRAYGRRDAQMRSAPSFRACVTGVLSKMLGSYCGLTPSSGSTRISESISLAL